ncbi:golgin subfamily A member 6-like protein 1 [Cimex lectularius]|uniref:Trichohyalin-plectin-homology domain-containing protein n=1 Tax=Cimex lectularius TaxID=79782 RepID=A0A8I6TJN4_CIMLE|nr:golgin subfamily A member 6-like protein 1 [Cimex lectularius]
MQKKEDKEKTPSGAQFNKMMKIPPDMGSTDSRLYSNVKMSPSVLKMLSRVKDDSEMREELLKDYDRFTFMKQGRTKVSSYSTPLTINQIQLDALQNKAVDLQPKERLKAQILSQRGREFYMRDACQKDQEMYQSGIAFKTEDIPEELQVHEAECALKLLDKKFMIFEQFPEIKDFNKQAAACQVQAIQGLQIKQNIALKKLPCIADKGKCYISDLKEDDADIVKERHARQEKAEKKLNLLLLLKNQIAEGDLLKKIAWEDKQAEAARSTKMDFETAMLEMEYKKEVDKEKELFRRDLKNMIQYNEDAIRYRAKERRLLLKRENDFVKQKDKFNLRCQNTTKDKQMEQDLHNEKVYALTKQIMDSKALKDAQYQEWLIWDTEKKLKKLEYSKTCKEYVMAIRNAILSERDFLTKFKEEQTKEEKRLEMEELANIQKWLDYSEKLQSAEPLKRQILMDKVRYIVLDQINENEKNKLIARENKFQEGTMLKNYQKAYDDLVRNRQRQKLSEYKAKGLPKTYVSHLKRKFNL